MHFADEALRALQRDHADGVSHILGRQHFCGIFQRSSRKLCRYTAGANQTDADPEAAQVFGHASGQALKAPL